MSQELLKRCQYFNLQYAVFNDIKEECRRRVGAEVDGLTEFETIIIRARVGQAFDTLSHRMYISFMDSKILSLILPSVLQSFGAQDEHCLVDHKG